MYSAFLFSILRFSYSRVGKTQLNVTAFYSHCWTDVYSMFRISWTESLETLTWLCRAISNLNCMKNKNFKKLGVIWICFSFQTLQPFPVHKISDLLRVLLLALLSCSSQACNQEGISKLQFRGIWLRGPSLGISESGERSLKLVD